jgi:hypothetical protein
MSRRLVSRGQWTVRFRFGQGLSSGGPPSDELCAAVQLCAAVCSQAARQLVRHNTNGGRPIAFGGAACWLCPSMSRAWHDLTTPQITLHSEVLGTPPQRTSRK